MALDNCHGGLTGWTYATEVAGATGVETVVEFHVFSVCAKYGPIISLGKWPGVKHVTPLFVLLGIVYIFIHNGGHCLGVLTMCQSCAWSHLIISIPPQGRYSHDLHPI